MYAAHHMENGASAAAIGCIVYFLRVPHSGFLCVLFIAYVLLMCYYKYIHISCHPHRTITPHPYKYVRVHVNICAIKSNFNFSATKQTHYSGFSFFLICCFWATAFFSSFIITSALMCKHSAWCFFFFLCTPALFAPSLANKIIDKNAQRLNICSYVYLFCCSTKSSLTSQFYFEFFGPWHLFELMMSIARGHARKKLSFRVLLLRKKLFVFH